MNHVKSYFFDRFNTFSLLFLSSTIALLLLMMRVKFTHSFYLMFMVWNLFLAFIPFAITAYLNFRLTPLTNWKLILCTGIWILFLPNAPYMITDLIHLFGYKSIFWLDSILILTFAINGLIFYFISVRDMKKFLKQYTAAFWRRTFFTCLPLLIAFGVYIGRFQRWNSWDIITNPGGLLVDMSGLLLNPVQNKHAWLFIVVFTLLLITVKFFLEKLKFFNKLN